MEAPIKEPKVPKQAAGNGHAACQRDLAGDNLKQKYALALVPEGEVQASRAAAPAAARELQCYVGDE
eukprot:CAMPEP_0203940762 /NCGR_PEP_ID=MMETSP0359-20131031/77268_1 /ASSEMBLY_ACC=CAM_ASM_000338 /TAXON_ID=268821 /ORGANISM="Scrippsiella Hangoei, Strain SHTV-5" /LENGTH=66 /DNA_ID=CAMNT_0050871223 /DNA_START=303 /DNA_END=500 /DNA_ORIENTATION=-